MGHPRHRFRILGWVPGLILLSILLAASGAAIANRANPQVIVLDDGTRVDGCPEGVEWVQATFDYFEAKGGGTKEAPAHPYGARIDQLPYNSELVASGGALVRPNPDGPGNDVVYELEELSDGTYLIRSVSYCLWTEERATEFSLQTTELTPEMIDDGVYIGEDGLLTDG